MTERDLDFELDLSGFEEPVDAQERRETPTYGPNAPGEAVPLEERLYRLVEPYGFETVEKAREMVLAGRIELTEEEGQAKTYAVRGSRPYSTRITRGEDFTYAECTCPNGTHRGGDANCYHSVAARVLDLGLESVWLGNTEPA